jgi:porin
LRSKICRAHGPQQRYCSSKKSIFRNFQLTRKIGVHIMDPSTDCARLLVDRAGLAARRSDVAGPARRGRFDKLMPVAIAFAVVCWSPVSVFAQTRPVPSQSPSATAPSQASPPAPAAATLTGEWGGLRSQLRDEGVDITGGFKGEVAGNVRGPFPAKAAESGEFVLGATIDTRKLFGLVGGTLQTSISIREGAPPPGHLLQQSEEVFGRGNIARLAELWYRQKLFDDLLTLKFGRIPQGDFNDFSCEFMNLTFCGAPGGNIVGNYWFNWPIAQWAAWARVNSGDFDVTAGVYEINPRDLDLNFAPGLFSGATGAMAHVEAGWSPKFGASGLQGHYQAGVWRDSSGGPDVLIGADGRPFALTGLAALRRGDRYGFYIQGQQQLTGAATYDPDSGWKNTKGLAFFFNFIEADRATSTLDNQFASGLIYAGPFDSRPNDAVGVAFGRTEYNSRAARAMALANPGAALPRAEYPIEVYYSYQVEPWLTVRPDFQYIANPGGFTHAPGEIMLGARTDIKF